MRTGLPQALQESSNRDHRMSRLEEEINSLASEIQSIGSKNPQKIANIMMESSNFSQASFSSGQKSRAADRFQSESIQSASSKKIPVARTSKLEVNVYCRLKPPRVRDSPITATSDSIAFTHKGFVSEFAFHRVFAEEASQAEVYEGAVRKSVLSAVYEGQSAVIFGFGVSGSGKTYTMLGSQQDGILQLACHDILGVSDHLEVDLPTPKDGSPPNKLKGLRELKTTGVKVSFSAYELHQDKLYDLLQGQVGDRIQQSASKTGFGGEKGFTIESVQSANDLQILLNRVEKTRKKRGTCYNDHSSRSHIFLRLQGVTELTDLSTGSYHTRPFMLLFVDLAGSERTSTIGHDAQSTAFKESCSINNSLLSLGRCLKTLARGEFPKFARENPLSKALMDSFEKCSTASIICTASSASPNPEETLKMLSYAASVNELEISRKQLPISASQPKLTEGRLLQTASSSQVSENSNSVCTLVDETGSDHVQSERPDQRLAIRHSVKQAEDAIANIIERLKSETASSRQSRLSIAPTVHNPAIPNPNPVQIGFGMNLTKESIVRQPPQSTTAVERTPDRWAAVAHKNQNQAIGQSSYFTPTETEKKMMLGLRELESVPTPMVKKAILEFDD